MSCTFEEAGYADRNHPSYHSAAWGRNYPRIQILTIGELLRGATVQMTLQYGTFRQAPRVAAAQHGRLELE